MTRRQWVFNKNWSYIGTLHGFFSLAKIGAYILSGIGAWLGYKKFKAVADICHEHNSHRVAEPFTAFLYRWSKELHNPEHQELILHIGNRERRPIMIKEIIWDVPTLKLKWPAELQQKAHNMRIPEAEGIEIELDPSVALDTILGGKHLIHS